MKICHWSMLNGSGMHAVAKSMVQGEIALGVDARLLDPFDATQLGWDDVLDADVHVNHTHIPDRIGTVAFHKAVTKPHRFVFPIHGTPELVFEGSVEDAKANGYGAGMSYAHHQRGMQIADAIVAFVPRHRDFYDLATDKHTIVDQVPMGIDTAFWGGSTVAGKYAGSPSFITAENQHAFKWCIDLVRVWPWVRAELDEAILHAVNIPGGMLRFVDVLAARCGSNHGSYIGAWSYDHENLRNIFRQCDYYISPVRYGDFNRACLEAKAAGCKVISFPSNPYADFWIPEGDQRTWAKALIRIGKGEAAARPDALPVPTLADMAHAMIGIYERVLDRPRTNFALGGLLPDALDATLIEALQSVRPTVKPTTPRPVTPMPADVTPAVEVRTGIHLMPDASEGVA